MSDATLGPKQRYKAVLQTLQELRQLKELHKDTAFTPLAQIITPKSGLRPAAFAADIGLTTFQQFKTLGPAFVHANAGACAQVLGLLSAALANGSSPSSDVVTNGVTGAGLLLQLMTNMLHCWLQVLPKKSPEGFDSLENSEVLPVVCKTGLLPQMGTLAALLAPLLSAEQPTSSSAGNSSSTKFSASTSRSSRSSSRTANAPASTDATQRLLGMSVSLLEAWVAIVVSDNKEEGFSISVPQCAAAVPSICTLGRAVLCSIPRRGPKGRGGALSFFLDEAMFNVCCTLGNFCCGHLHMQYCKAFAGKAPTSTQAPERGCSRETAHRLARSEDFQWMLLAFLGIQLAGTHQLTKGGTQVQSAIGNLPGGITPKALMQAISAQLAKSTSSHMQEAHKLLSKQLDATSSGGDDYDDFDDDAPFANTGRPVEKLHEKLLRALGMARLVESGNLAKWIESKPLNHQMSRIALWAVEHQFLQVDVPEPGIVGIPCGAHGAVLAALSEYLVTVGPESVQFHACLPVAQRVVQDYADKMASGTLPAHKSAAAAPAGPSTSSSQAAAEGPAGDEQPLDAGMVDGLAALLVVAVPACVPNARRKDINQMIADIMEPSWQPVMQMKPQEWANWLLQQLWGIMNSLLTTTGSTELLTAALWQQPATAAASLEWLIRFGPLNPAAQEQQQGSRDTIRLIRRITATCVAPPSAAAAAKAQVTMADLLLSMLKRLKLITQQSATAAPPAAYRAIADIAAAAATLGAAVSGTASASSTRPMGTGKTTKAVPKSSGSSSGSSSDCLSVKKGPALWAVVSCHCLWWLGTQLPAALEATAAAAVSPSSSAAWADDVPEQLLGTFKSASCSVSWLATVQPGLPALLAATTASSSLTSPPVTKAGLWQNLQQDIAGEAGPAVEAAVGALKQAAAGESVQWQDILKAACAVLVRIGGGLSDLLPCAVCCNRPGCCQLSAESERRSAESDKGVLMKCSGCRAAHYCSKRCHKLAWPNHKLVCKLTAA